MTTGVLFEMQLNSNHLVYICGTLKISLHHSQPEEKLLASKKKRSGRNSYQDEELTERKAALRGSNWEARLGERLKGGPAAGFGKGKGLGEEGSDDEDGGKKHKKSKKEK